MTDLQAWEICWKGLGARQGESIYDAAKRARYHGHERARASEILLGIQDIWAPAAKWAAIQSAAQLLAERVQREEAKR